MRDCLSIVIIQVVGESLATRAMCPELMQFIALSSSYPFAHPLTLFSTLALIKLIFRNLRFHFYCYK